ncbi:hypothetical protein CI711_01380 [Shigella boydii]|nr:hypothetical protein CI711_01380 [Shigella boydii]
MSECSTENIVKSVTVGNHSILALSEVHQPVVARTSVRRATVSFIRCAVKPRPSGRGGCQLDALELVDTSGAPDIEWPTPPAVQAR